MLQQKSPFSQEDLNTDDTPNKVQSSAEGGGGHLQARGLHWGTAGALRAAPLGISVLSVLPNHNEPAIKL